ncbi:reticulon-like protein B8 isoform X2 [Euphorbia lathyris]|uniref:reticulon-like protein B8 isoform X2 n=2 Tax=Euphorbia lathyris TaxID=212925 RepID=UPI0033132740
MQWFSFGIAIMADKITAEKLLNNLAALADSIPRQKSVSFFEEETSSVTYRLNRLFGRQEPLHLLLGGGKSADVLLWRNKKISASVVTGATAIWVLFEWLNYHFLTLVCFGLVLGMLAQFVWRTALGLLNRSSPKVPRFVLSDDIFVNIGRTIGVEVNHALKLLQDVSTGGNLKQFLVVIASLWAAAVIGSWCNFLTVFYIGFVAAHTLPVLYERYEDEVDDFVYKVFEQLKGHHSKLGHYSKLVAGLLSKIPKGNLRGKKHQ